MAARNDAGGTVLFGEIGNGQHHLQPGLAAVLRMAPERRGVIAMQGLQALSRTDLDSLGKAELNVWRYLDSLTSAPYMGRGLQDLLCRLDEQGMQRNAHCRIASCDEAGDTSSLGTREVGILAIRRFIQVDVELCFERLQCLV
ncbi:hypothetical protein D9M71_599950 [compost metagenome]